MTDTGIFCSTVEVQRKAGSAANSTANSEAYINDYVAQVESSINAITRFNWSEVYSTLPNNTKQILKETASNLAAIYVISWDMGDDGEKRVNSEDRINILRDAALRNISILRDKKVETFIKGA